MTPAVRALIAVLFLCGAILIPAKAQQYVISTYAGGAPLTAPLPAWDLSIATDFTGNAYMDVAAAACLVSGILQPEASDIGGYVLCAVVLEGSSGRLGSLDANSAAPAGARERMYQVGPLGAEKIGIYANEYA